MRNMLIALITLTFSTNAATQRFVPLVTPRGDDITASVYDQVGSMRDLCPGTTNVLVKEARMLAMVRGYQIIAPGSEVANIYACMLRANGHTLRQFRGTFQKYGATSDSNVWTMCTDVLYHNDIFHPSPPRRMPNIAIGYCVPEAWLDKEVEIPSVADFNMILLGPTNRTITFRAKETIVFPLDEPPIEGAGKTGFEFYGIEFTVTPDAERPTGETSPLLFKSNS